MSDPVLGRTIAKKYAIESLIGRGAMGSVYTARHLTLDTTVAVKVLHSDLATDAAFAERFHREAKSASRLHHANVIQVIDFGREDDGLFYIAMEYVAGVDLFSVIQREWPINGRRIGEIVCQILSGIAAAHDIGIVHRDLKPENIIVTRGLDDEGREHDLVKVCDFGIAKIEEPRDESEPREGERTLTTRGLLLGTPQYMSPEQCRGDTLDARSDVYSVGVVLYQLLSGRLPFHAATTVDIVIKQVTEEPVPPTRIYPSAPANLEAICLRALRKLPEQRYASAREMSAEIRQTLLAPVALTATDAPSAPAPPGRASLPSAAPHTFVAPTGGPVQTKLDSSVPNRKVRKGTYGALLAVVVAVGASVVWFRDRSNDRHDPPAPRAAVAAILPTSLHAEEPPGTKEAARSMDPEPTPSVADKTSGGAKKSKGSHRAAPDRVRELAAREEPPQVAPAEPHVAELPSAPARAAIVPESVPRPAVPPPVTTLNPEKGRVSWKVSAVGGGATAGGVARALSRAANTWTSCYRSGLRGRGKSIEGKGVLRLSCDDQGRVVRATVSGFALQDVSACIRESTAGVTIPNSDTGEAWANVALTFDVPQ